MNIVDTKKVVNLEKNEIELPLKEIRGLKIEVDNIYDDYILLNNKIIGKIKFIRSK